ncbi:AimR family lysis-lysogeny pheromone receptor [Bacillus cereus]|uniref:AimR family lysis-lysogeny pheromone receptor n=1 Tax=Bacillus cereus TaxID=1396 RepID=UPI00215C8341|nr:AimR family lysis-lysogeny pheromone receptor [Bacillus cereus]
MFNYCNQAKRKVNLRVAFEYIDMCGELELLNHLIVQEKQSNNLLNRKFANAYELLYLRNADEFNPREFLKLVKGEMGKQKKCRGYK